MPNMILRAEFDHPQYLMITEIDIEQYVVPRQVKASELAAAIEAEDGELCIDYKGYRAVTIIREKSCAKGVMRMSMTIQPGRGDRPRDNAG
ncbi:MAG: hypothetical protein V3S24_16255 [Candidatus Tectomicrobia bacterium]